MNLFFLIDSSRYIHCSLDNHHLKKVEDVKFTPMLSLIGSMYNVLYWFIDAFEIDLKFEPYFLNWSMIFHINLIALFPIVFQLKKVIFWSIFKSHIPLLFISHFASCQASILYFFASRVSNWDFDSSLIFQFLVNSICLKFSLIPLWVFFFRV